MKEAPAIRLEQFYGLFLKPSYRCAQNLRTFLKHSKSQIAMNTQKTTNTFTTSDYCSALCRRTAIMIVVDMPSPVAAGLICAADAAEF